MLQDKSLWKECSLLMYEMIILFGRNDGLSQLTKCVTFVNDARLFKLWSIVFALDFGRKFSIVSFFVSSNVISQIRMALSESLAMRDKNHLFVALHHLIETTSTSMRLPRDLFTRSAKRLIHYLQAEQTLPEVVEFLVAVEQEWKRLSQLPPLPTLKPPPVFYHPI
jgi:hypothetical protein